MWATLQNSEVMVVISSQGKKKWIRKKRLLAVTSKISYTVLIHPVLKTLENALESIFNLAHHLSPGKSISEYKDVWQGRYAVSKEKYCLVVKQTGKT